MTSKVAVATMKAAQVISAGAGLQLVELEVPDPGPGQVRIQVHACGVCHSDAIIVEGRRPGIPYPRVPGHEVVGIVDALGAGVTEWKKGQRVGVGWHGGHDGTCPECRRGDFRLCRNEKNPGLSYDGGYQEYMVAPVEALVPIPNSLTDVEAAPLLCAGSATFNALRRTGAQPGDLVALQGIGGLGHLGIQFAHKFGFKVAAVGRGQKIESLAMKLGAQVYIDSSANNAAEELQKLGGARVIIATAPDSKAMRDAVAHNEGLGANWKTRRAFWEDRAANESALRTNLLSLKTTRARHVGNDPNVERHDLDLWTDEFYFLNQPGQAEIQSDLFYDYRTNVDSYPKWQQWLRENQPRLLVIWGKYEVSFDAGEPERYRKDVPKAEVHVVDGGHFALDTAADEVAALVQEFMKAQK